ncbi:MAG: hypothetical protein AUK24_01775 [Syntrophaceae bacterium CG2_30_49_12]|nr:MAG: hypothetical protein AUK24_01775 [Syntrophaceae bacterium CG2_30_49_12]PIP04896.1 MAG: hypothetical protein COX52_14910 [Syntrophobacterales bacterium CG23_combo_of_CG06-09_8_20_14_all_48_27]PJC72744.1 MAG: hypothetical protein CO012_11390 [Syntrophobacterales bacterium CG_4_8_14_3_um_filter_49_14]
MVREEILKKLPQSDRLFEGLHLVKEEQDAILSALIAGHHLLILGPTGAGKTSIALRLGGLLGDLEVIANCPLNCLADNPECPWCLERIHRGETLTKTVLPAAERLKRLQGGSGLAPEDLIGGIDPEAALNYGLHSLSSLSPGKLLRSNRGILLIDFIDRMPERVLNTLLYALDGGVINLGASEERLCLDMLVVATGSPKMLEYLPLGVLECFDVVHIGYPVSMTVEKMIARDRLAARGKMLTESASDIIGEIVTRTRMHGEVERGVSTRGLLHCHDLLVSLKEMCIADERKRLEVAAAVSLPHRLEVVPHADLPGRKEQIVNEILEEVLGEGETAEKIVFSRDDLLSLVEEIAREDRFRKPLKYGAFDILLKRVQRFPDSKLAEVVRKMAARMKELYPERYGQDRISMEMLADIEEARKREERVNRIRRQLEADALTETINHLEEYNILEKGKQGWELSRRGLSFLLERLTPRLITNILYGYGKHPTGKKLTVGEGREVGIRHFRFGDRYRDVSLKDTIRETIRNRRQSVTRKDIMVVTKDVRMQMDIVLVVDLSGTMVQLEKLWHAKECAIALSLAASQFRDRVGVVSFSNLADVVVDITDNPYHLTQRVLNLELHPNAFTNIGYGILKATQLFSRHRRGRAVRHMIVISDGDATAPHPSPQKYALRQATSAARKGITISCVCIGGESTDPELMRRIARIGKGRIYFVGAETVTTAVLAERVAARA